MSASDYTFVESAFGNVYLAKRASHKTLMSEDRREVTDNEIIGLFHNYLKRYCKKNNTDLVNITTADGRTLFTAKLEDK